ncbi:uncharacterized protein LOC129292085 [Prosopis cineraria]|uniref:uncharacterized protein LOC129292085 n=1 Tax=Prosopis cineraria TaxID=364024 RepID=UPI00241019FB|nr:uncharacterized protein LOC129292085 [Prosopis cineraria]
MKKAILIAFLILVSTIFLSLPSSTHARLLLETTSSVTSPSKDPNKPAVKCPPGSPYSSCIGKSRPSPAPCSDYTRNCKK